MFDLYRNPETTKNSDFHQACLRGDTMAAERLLDEGAEIDCVQSDLPALLAAVAGKHWDTAKMLLDRGAEPNCMNLHGWSPLHAAAAAGHEEMISRMIGAGAFVNRRDGHGETALYEAAKANRLEAVRLLLSLGGDPDIGNKKGDTPLHWASRHESEEMANDLLAKGARASRENREGETPVTLAPESLRAVLERADLARSVEEAIEAATPKAPENEGEAAPAPTADTRKRSIRKV